MADDRNPHDDRGDHSAGFDVWLPAAAAIAAAFFMIAAAHAEPAAVPVSDPQPIYEAWRFDEAAIAQEAAEASAARAAAEAGMALRRQVEVRVIALPELAATPAPAAAPMAAMSPTPPAAALETSQPRSGWGRLAAALGIAALLIGALFGIARVWQRTEPSLA